MAAGEGAATEPKRRWKMNEMMGERMKETGGLRGLFLNLRGVG
jgi:hypothetical protein